MPEAVLLERPRPLSDSSLWRTQDRFYREAGPRAWATGEIPHTLTSGPLVARAYAEIVTGYLLDAAAGRLGSIDPAEPVYLVELGAGTGRLAFHFHRALEQCQASGLDVVYVLTDAVEANLEFSRIHPRLRPLAESGRLDWAHLDVTGDGELLLERSGRLLGPGLGNPLVVLANYCFDVVPQDLFAGSGEELRELHVGIVARDREVDLASEDLFRQVLLVTDAVPVLPGRYEPPVAALLAATADASAGQRFLFPAATLAFLERLAASAGDRLLLLVGERPGGLPELPPPDGGKAGGPGTVEAHSPGALLGMGIHGGSCSLPVDLGILGQFAAAHRGAMLLPSASPAGLLIAAFVLGTGEPPPTLAQRFVAAVDEGGPEDRYLALRATLDNGTPALPLALALALVRVSGYDPYLMRELYALFEERLPEAVEAGVDEAFRVLREVAAREYPIDERTDVAFGVALLFARIGRYREALELLEASRALHGPRPESLFNAALCRLHLGEPAVGAGLLEEALHLDPGMDAARRLLDGLATGDLPRS